MISMSSPRTEAVKIDDFVLTPHIFHWSIFTPLDWLLVGLFAAEDPWGSAAESWPPSAGEDVSWSPPL